jgi:hypothetical protein
MKVQCYRSLHLKNAHEPNGIVFTFAALAARNCTDCFCENICDRSGHNLAPGCETYKKIDDKGENHE